MRINVDGLPFIREMTTPRKLLAGSRLEWLYCPYGGFPIDKITWDKDGKHKEVGTYSAVAPIFFKRLFLHFCQCCQLVIPSFGIWLLRIIKLVFQRAALGSRGLGVLAQP